VGTTALVTPHPSNDQQNTVKGTDQPVTTPKEEGAECSNYLQMDIRPAPKSATGDIPMPAVAGEGEHVEPAFATGGDPAEGGSRRDLGGHGLPQLRMGQESATGCQAAASTAFLLNRSAPLHC
jgi:hypothetical protein